MTALLAILGYFNISKLTDIGSLVDAVIFALIAIGIHRAWRSAAVGGLAFYLIERIYNWSQVGFTFSWLAIIISIAFVNSIRGTYWIASKRNTNRATALTNTPIN